MHDWITIHRVDAIYDAQLIKVQLELEGIEAEIPDEYTAQTIHIYSSAIGGVRIQVREKHQERAREILLELGYIKVEEVKPIKVFIWLDKFTSKIPLLRKLNAAPRVLLFIGILLFVLLVPFYDLSIPTLSDELMDKSWCVGRVEYKGIELEPIHSTKLIIINNCADHIWFNENGVLHLPRYENVLTPESWNEYKDGLYIHTDTRYLDSAMTDVFEGAYTASLEDGRLELRSKTTFILLYQMSY